MNTTDEGAGNKTPAEAAIDGTGGVAAVDLATAPAKVIAREARRLTAAAHESMLRLLEFTEALDSAGRAELVPFADHEIEEADLSGDVEATEDMEEHNDEVPKSIVEAFETVSDYFSE